MSLSRASARDGGGDGLHGFASAVTLQDVKARLEQFNLVSFRAKLPPFIFHCKYCSGVAGVCKPRPWFIVGVWDNSEEGSGQFRTLGLVNPCYCSDATPGNPLEIRWGEVFSHLN